MDLVLVLMQLFGIAVFFYWLAKAINWLGDLPGKRRKSKEEAQKKKERESSETPRLGDAVAKEPPPAQISTKRQPSSKEFWDAQRAAPDFESRTAQARKSMPRIVPVSHTKQTNESADRQARSRMLREVLGEVVKPLPIATTLDELLPAQEALIEIGVIKRKWQPLVEFAENAKQQALSCCDLKLLRPARGISVDCELKVLLQPVSGISVKSDFSFVMEIQSKYGPIDRDGFCDAFALKGDVRGPFEQALVFEHSLDGALAALFIKVALPRHWAWGHGLYDRDQRPVTTSDSAIAILQQDRVSPENPQLRNLTVPPGIRVSRRDNAMDVGCLAYRPGKGFSDIVVTIEGGQLFQIQERVLFHWGQGILY